VCFITYAFDRPPVHQHFLRSVRLDQQPVQALDIGCGAGLSTAAAVPLAPGRVCLPSAGFRGAFQLRSMLDVAS
jgi:hypothetical protein